MNQKLKNFKEDIKFKKIAVLGMGVSNKPLIRFLSKLQVEITAFDKACADQLGDYLHELDQLKVGYSLGADYLKKLQGFDIIFRTPGMRPDVKEILLEVERGAKLVSEMEVFMELCPAPVFAVTGSDGKTTTTTLIYQILTKEGYQCWLGGNIGMPLLDKIEEIEPCHKVILELSSFQLMTMTKSPQVAVITNISPNHLDVHLSMEEYVNAKKTVLQFQGPEDTAILNHDNEITQSFVSQAKGKCLSFTRVGQIERGAYVKNNAICFRDDLHDIEVVNISEIAIPGVHNVENYLAATASTMQYVKAETIKEVAKSFNGVAHRIEFVREIAGVKFYNDSIASSPSRTIAGLNSFPQKVILIAGGKDKNIPYDMMGAVLLDKVKSLILIGPTGPKIEKALKDEAERTATTHDIQIYKATTYEEVVLLAYDIASPGDIVILSPASTSFDMFKNFEERGNVFKQLVQGLLEKK